MMLLSSAPLEFVDLDIHGRLAKSERTFAYNLVIRDRLSKVSRAISLKRTSKGGIVNAFLQNWVFAYEITLYLLTENVPQVAAKLCSAIAEMLAMKQLFTTPYYL